MPQWHAISACMLSTGAEPKLRCIVNFAEAQEEPAKKLFMYIKHVCDSISQGMCYRA